MIGLLGLDVAYHLQQYLETNVDPPEPSDLIQHGDFSIFVDGINKLDLGKGLLRTAVPTAFPGHAPEPLRTNFPYSNRIDDYMTNSSFDRISLADDSDGSPRPSMELDKKPRPHPNPRSPAASISSASLSGIARVNSLSGGTYSAELFPTTQYIGNVHSRPSTSGTSGPPSIRAIPKKLKPDYSWNEIVDRSNLGVRPGEVEILPGDFATMNLMASYTGDRHGRWDNCRVRIFKLTSDKTLRILTLMEGLEESIDQRMAYVKEAELVPDYGYHPNNPVIYIRKTHRQDPFVNATARKIAAGKPMPPSSLYYKFRNARGTPSRTSFSRSG